MALGQAQHPMPPWSSLQPLPSSPHPCNWRPYSLAPILGLLELVPFVLGVLLLQGPNPSDDLLQCLVGLLGVIDDERRILFLLGAVIHRSAPTGLCSVRDRAGGQCEWECTDKLPLGPSLKQPPQERADHSEADAPRNGSHSHKSSQH